MKTFLMMGGRILLEFALGFVAVCLVDYAIGLVAFRVLHHTPTEVIATMNHLGGPWPVLLFIVLCESLLVVRRRRCNLARIAVKTS